MLLPCNSDDYTWHIARRMIYLQKIVDDFCMFSKIIWVILAGCERFPALFLRRIGFESHRKPGIFGKKIGQLWRWFIPLPKILQSCGFQDLDFAVPTDFLMVFGQFWIILSLKALKLQLLYLTYKKFKLYAIVRCFLSSCNISCTLPIRNWNIFFWTIRIP